MVKKFIALLILCCLYLTAFASQPLDSEPNTDNSRTIPVSKLDAKPDSEPKLSHHNSRTSQEVSVQSTVNKTLSLYACMIGDALAHSRSIFNPSTMIATICATCPENFEFITTKKYGKNLLMGWLTLSAFIYPDIALGSIPVAYSIKHLAKKIGLNNTQLETVIVYLGAYLGGFLSSEFIVPAAVSFAQSMAPDMLNPWSWYSYFSS